MTSADNQFVYVTNMFENTVSVIDNEKNQVIKTIPVEEKNQTELPFKKRDKIKKNRVS
ncbi:hypothetical protein GCM10020331_054860 [Ectobacillus funiculus]